MTAIPSPHFTLSDSESDDGKYEDTIRSLKRAAKQASARKETAGNTWGAFQPHISRVEREVLSDSSEESEYESVYSSEWEEEIVEKEVPYEVEVDASSVGSSSTTRSNLSRKGRRSREGSVSSTASRTKSKAKKTRHHSMVADYRDLRAKRTSMATIQESHESELPNIAEEELHLTSPFTQEDEFAGDMNNQENIPPGHAPVPQETGASFDRSLLRDENEALARKPSIIPSPMTGRKLSFATHGVTPYPGHDEVSPSPPWILTVKGKEKQTEKRTEKRPNVSAMGAVAGLSSLVRRVGKRRARPASANAENEHKNAQNTTHTVTESSVMNDEPSFPTSNADNLTISLANANASNVGNTLESMTRKLKETFPSPAIPPQPKEVSHEKEVKNDSENEDSTQSERQTRKNTLTEEKETKKGRRKTSRGGKKKVPNQDKEESHSHSPQGSGKRRKRKPRQLERKRRQREMDLNTEEREEEEENEHAISQSRRRRRTIQPVTESSDEDVQGGMDEPDTMPVMEVAEPSFSGAEEHDIEMTDRHPSTEHRICSPLLMPRLENGDDSMSDVPEDINISPINAIPIPTTVESRRESRRRSSTSTTTTTVARSNRTRRLKSRKDSVISDDGDNMAQDVDALDTPMPVESSSSAARKQSKKKSRTKSNRQKKKKKNPKKTKKKKDTKKTSTKAKNRKRKKTESPMENPGAKRIRTADEIIIMPDTPADAGLRRSKRIRFKPLRYWTTERIEPTRDILTKEKLEEMGSSLVVNPDAGVDFLESFETKQTKKKKPARKGKGKKKKKKGKEREESELTDDDEDPTFDGGAYVFDSITDSMKHSVVSKIRRMVPIVALNQNIPEDQTPLSQVQQVLGGKGLEEDDFSCGFLEIPPDSKKFPEITLMTEVFFVRSAEKKSLVFEISQSIKYLSKDSMFFVPPDNQYSLTNLSKTHPVKLFFVLVKRQFVDDEEPEGSPQ